MPPIDIVIDEARARKFRVQRLTGYGKVLDSRLVLVEQQICQVIPTHRKPVQEHPEKSWVPLYLPRNRYADFLIYLVQAPERFCYVVPRGAMSKDTGRSVESMEQYRNAWDLLQQKVAPALKQRRFTIINHQLQTIIDAAEHAKLEITLIGRKHPGRWPVYQQRRVIVADRKCAVYTWTRLTRDPTNSAYECVFVRTPQDGWAEFQLCVVNGDESVYVIPRGVIPEKTTLSLNNPHLAFHANNWKLLSLDSKTLATTPRIESLLPKLPKPAKPIPVVIVRTTEQAKARGLTVEKVPGTSSQQCLYIAKKTCQIMSSKSVRVSGRSYIPLNLPSTDWAEFVIFAVPDGNGFEFYVVPRSRLRKRTVTAPSGWIREYKDQWQLLR